MEKTDYIMVGQVFNLSGQTESLSYLILWSMHVRVDCLRSISFLGAIALAPAELRYYIGDFVYLGEM
jgi:hypothetical protein